MSLLIEVNFYYNRFNYAVLAAENSNISTKMSKKKIILLLGIKIREFDFFRYDLYEFEKKRGFQVEAHELIDYTKPGFSKIFTKKFSSNKIKKFNSFNSWKKEILKQKKLFKDNLLVINEIGVANFKTLRINFLLKKRDIKNINFSGISHPDYTPNTDYMPKNIIKKIYWFLLNLISNKKKIFIYFESRICSLIKILLNLKPNYILIFNKNENISSRKKNYLTVKGNSRDYNMFLKCKNKPKRNKKKYGIFLDSPAPVHNQGDLFITGDDISIRGTRKKWLRSLNNFFDFIEKKLNIEIFIAPHPKLEYSNELLKVYNGRRLLKEKLVLGSKNAKVIISRDSAAASFAAIYKVPAIFVYTNELKRLKNNFMNYQKNFANEFGLKPINIDTEISGEKLKELLTFKNDKYNRYVKKYCTARKDKKINYQIISDYIFNS